MNESVLQMTIAGKQCIAPVIKVKVRFQVKAHQTIYNTQTFPELQL